MPRAATSVATRTRCLPFGEALEGGGALRLAAVAVDDVGVVAELFELLRDAVGSVLGAREDEEGSLLFAQHLVEQAELLVLHDGVDAEFDAVGGLGGAGRSRCGRGS